MCSSASAQDERYIKKLLLGKLGANKGKLKRPSPPKWAAYSSIYRFDLNGDGHKEMFFHSKSDSVDYFHFYDHNERPLLKVKLDPMGAKSAPYKMRIVDLDKTKRLFMIYFYEGFTKFYGLEASVRLYLVTMDYADLNSLIVKKGPVLWMERERRGKRYVKRESFTEISDYNKDGVKDLRVFHGKLSRVYFYQGAGKWRAIGDKVF